ncbi:MAG: phosphate regulon sensor histidine kinase PhoR [Proteobacteria bacterium]|nr:phosphate regulon sensor histidine kinase PhoR [Pseudomonadota bacterium]
MSESMRKVIIGVGLLLATGALVGWSYGNLERGLLVAAALVLLWMLRNLVFLERAIQRDDFTAFRFGEGICQQLFSQFRYERERGDRYKSQRLQLLKEIRRSTRAMPDGAIILDAQLEIITCNRAAKSLAGLKPKKDRGQRVDNIIRDPALTELLRANDPAMTADIESPLQDYAWLNCRLVPYGAGQKLLIIRDVTERMRLNKMRRDFIANASHELRSPLTVICGYLDSFVDEASVPAEMRQPILQMQAQAQRMSGIVQDLLQLSHVEGSGGAGDDELVDVHAVLTAAADTYSSLDSSPEIRLEVESSARIIGVTREIESVVANLVSNAVRHTPKTGRIRLSWRVTDAGAELGVSDNGEGIAEQHIPRLTERFFRVDRGRSRADGGIGLGLAIVKHILQRHDARLEIKSAPGQGSEFRCCFPAERVSAAS